MQREEERKNGWRPQNSLLTGPLEEQLSSILTPLGVELEKPEEHKNLAPMKSPIPSTTQEIDSEHTLHCLFLFFEESQLETVERLLQDVLHQEKCAIQGLTSSGGKAGRQQEGYLVALATDPFPEQVLTSLKASGKIIESGTGLLYLYEEETS